MTAARPLTDANSPLLARLRAGESEAYELLVRDNTGRMLAVARRYLRNEEDARDAVQEAFVCAFRSVAGFEGAAQPSTWLHRIVVNACLMRLRSKRRKPEESVDELLPRFLEDGHHAAHPADWSLGAQQQLEVAETQAFVRACIDRLPESYRTVVLLRDIDEVDTEEVAALLGVTTNVVKVRLHRARQALRSLLEPRFREGLL